MYTKYTCALTSYCRSMIIMLIYYNDRLSLRHGHWSHRYELCRYRFSPTFSFIWWTWNCTVNLPLCRAKLMIFILHLLPKKVYSVRYRSCHENVEKIFPYMRVRRIEREIPSVMLNSFGLITSYLETRMSELWKICQPVPVSSAFRDFSQRVIRRLFRFWESLLNVHEALTAKRKSTQRSLWTPFV